MVDHVPEVHAWKTARRRPIPASVMLPDWLTPIAWVRAMGEGRDLMSDRDHPPGAERVFRAMGAWNASGTVAHLEIRYSSTPDVLRTRREVLDGFGRLVTLLVGTGAMQGAAAPRAKRTSTTPRPQKIT